MDNGVGVESRWLSKLWIRLEYLTENLELKSALGMIVEKSSKPKKYWAIPQLADGKPIPPPLIIAYRLNRGYLKNALPRNINNTTGKQTTVPNKGCISRPGVGGFGYLHVSMYIYSWDKDDVPNRWGALHTPSRWQQV